MPPAARFIALFAASAALHCINDEFVRDLGPLDLGDVPPVECAAEEITVVAALEIVRLASLSVSATALIDSSSAQMRSNQALHASSNA